MGLRTDNYCPLLLLNFVSRGGQSRKAHLEFIVAFSHPLNKAAMLHEPLDLMTFPCGPQIIRGRPSGGGPEKTIKHRLYWSVDIPRALPCAFKVFLEEKSPFGCGRGSGPGSRSRGEYET